jgi:kynurenine formamidase
LAKESSILLAKERDVLGVGVETVGTDAGQAASFDPPFPNHYLMHGSGKFGLASLCNLDQLPPTGTIVIAAPLKIVGGPAVHCGSLPSRLEAPVAVVSKESSVYMAPLI